MNLGNSYKKPVDINTKKANNAHILLLGESGSGKTVQTQKLMLEIVKEGGTVLAFDTNGIFADSQILPAYKSDFLANLNEIDAYKDGIKIPLFAPLNFSDGKTEKDVDVINGIVEAFKCTFNLGVAQAAELKAATKAVYKSGAYKTHGIRSIASELALLDNKTANTTLQRISQVLEHNLFKDGTFFIQKGKINLLRLSDFSESTQWVAIEILSAFIWKMASHGALADYDIQFVFDEFHNMNLGKHGIVGKLLVEGRKYGLNLLLSTQVLSADTRMQKLMMQAATILFFKSAKSEIATIASLISAANPSPWKTVLSKLKLGEFVVVGQLLWDGKEETSPLEVSAFISDEDSVNQEREPHKNEKNRAQHTGR